MKRSALLVAKVSVSLALLARCRIQEHIERRRTAKGLALANAAPLRG